MPIIKSAAKRMRQTSKRRARNIQTKRSLKAASKDLETAINNGDKKVHDLLKDLQSAIDTAAKKNVIHINKASRLKSRYNAKVKALGIAKPTAAKKPVAKPAAKPAAKKPAAKTATKTTAKKAPAKKPAAKK